MSSPCLAIYSLNNKLFVKDYYFCVLWDVVRYMIWADTQ